MKLQRKLLFDCSMKLLQACLFALICREGLLLGLGNPLLDIIAVADKNFLDK